MAGIFEVGSADVLKKLRPQASTEYGFKIGDTLAGADMSTADAEEVILDATAKVLARLPARERGLMRRVDGEVAVRAARAGQTTFRCGLAPVVEGSLLIYLGEMVAAWDERTPEMALGDDERTVNWTSGEVTLAQGLEAGTRVVVEYEHAAAASFRELRDCVCTLAAVEIARRFAFFRSADGFERFDQWEVSTNVFLRDLAAQQRPGIEGLERIELLGKIRKSAWREMFNEG